MIKKTLITVLGLGLLVGFVFGRDAFSYLATSYSRMTGAVKDSVPIEFQIDRAREMVGNLEPEIRHAMHVIAKEEVELTNLQQQIGVGESRAEKSKGEILHLQADLQDGKNVYRYAGRSYSAEQVREDLARRFNRHKVADDTLVSLKGMRDAREKNLDAARQKLTAMISARQRLAVDIENLEAKRKLVEVAQASSDYVFDDSQLARAKELITDIRTRLDVAAKLASADVGVEVEIPLDEETTADVTDQVAEYFGLGGTEPTATVANYETK
jgi:chromosome segregation ATPase